MIRWAVLSILAAGLFYGLYVLLFRRYHHLQLNRWYLMATMTLSLVYPLVSIPEIPVSFGLPTYVVDNDFEIVALPEGATGTLTAPTHDDAGVGSNLVLVAVVYLIGVVVSLAITALQFIRLTLKLRHIPSQTKKGHLCLHLLNDDTSPFSFFNHIVLGTKGLDGTQQELVISHEELHVRQHHTLDVLLSRLLCCIAWFNPFIWQMQRELRMVHEYLADEAVLAEHGMGSYLELLYREATGFGYGHITNNFQSINIKNRITMIKRKKTRFCAWKLLSVVPIAVVLMAFSCRDDDVAIGVAEGQQGKAIMTINYHKEGGKKLPFVGFGYYTCHSQLELDEGSRWVGNVTCTGEGWATSDHNWELSDFSTTKGNADGRVLNRNEKRLLKAIDRQLLDGKTEGALYHNASVKAEQGTIDLTFAAVWRNGNTNGDADITLSVWETADAVQNLAENLPACVGAGNAGPEFSGGIAVDVMQPDLPDTDPEFVGGIDSLYRYIVNNIHYPEKAKAEGVSGRVYVRFIVETDGSVTNAEVLRGIGSDCDEEALRVVQAMPRWKPATKDGHPVRAQYHLPIYFKLQ